MRTLLIFILGLIMYNTGHSQTLERQIISSMGISTDQTDLSVGECIIAGNPALTQGFHQGKLIITHLTMENSAVDIKVFPNPTSSLLFIDTGTMEDFDLQLFDASGIKHLGLKDKSGPQKISLQYLAPGNYVLVISGKKGLIQSSLIQKTN